MDTIEIHDKKFRVCTTASQIDEAVSRVAQQINEDLKDTDTPIFEH